MSNKSTESKQTVVVKADGKSPSAPQGTLTSSLKSSPIFGWFDAGADIISAELDQLAGLVSKQIDKTHETLREMQVKGGEVEADLKRSLNPFVFFDATQNLLKSSSLYATLSGSKKQKRKAHQIDELSAKVDALVEQVALLAAKEALKQAEETAPPEKTVAAQTSTTAIKADVKTTPSAAPATTRAKPANVKATSTTSSAVKTAASKPAAKKTAPSKNQASKATASKATAPKAPKSTGTSSESAASPVKKSNTSATKSDTSKKSH